MGSKEGFGVFLRNWGSAFSFVSIFLDADSQEEKKLDQFVEDDDDEDEASPGSWHRQRTALRTAVEGGQRSSSAPWISTQQKTWLTRSWAAFWMLLVPLSWITSRWIVDRESRSTIRSMSSKWRPLTGPSSRAKRGGSFS